MKVSTVKVICYFAVVLASIIASLVGGIVALKAGANEIATGCFVFCAGGAVTAIYNLKPGNNSRSMLPLVLAAIAGAVFASSGCAPSLNYDPQCAIDVAQKCVEQMKECEHGEVDETESGSEESGTDSGP